MRLPRSQTGACTALGQGHEHRQSRRRAGIAVHQDGIFGRHLQPRRLLHRLGIAGRHGEACQLRHRGRRAVADRTFLQLGVGNHRHRRHGRRRRQRIGADQCIAEMVERARLVVPFREIAYPRRAVLHAMRPFYARPALVRVAGVAGEQDDRDAVAKRVVDRHRRVLPTNGAVDQRRHRPAGRLGIAMGDAHR
jgi:hypothetical protein